MSTPLGLQLRGLTKQFGHRAAVNRLDLDVANGELLILVGPSGSGKSTLLRMIAGLTPHDHGTVHVNGRDVSTLPAAERDIAMVFQSYALFPHLTIFDNLAFGLQARGVAAADIQKRVTDVAQLLELTALLQRPPAKLSGGERQRVALGRAMLREPRLFLLDEPLSNLDAKLRVQTRAEILALHERLKTTMVYVTHDQVEALSLGDRVGVLRDGVLLDIGPPQDIYRRPRTLFVARFLGSPPMNAVTVQAAPPQQVLWQGQPLSLPEPWARAVQQACGMGHRQFVLGVRPEHVFLKGSRWAQGEPSAMAITATVQTVEYAGDQIYLQLGVGTDTVMARVEPDFPVQRGQEHAIWLHPEGLHLFDPETEVSLLHGGGPALSA